MQEKGEGKNRSLLEAFDGLEDPRTRECAHRLDELLLVALCAITSGADSWVSVVGWAKLKVEWLSRFFAVFQRDCLA